MPTFSPREAPVEGSDYALSFENKASKVHLLMEKGTDVKFEGDVDNINVEYVSSDKGNKEYECYHWTAEDIAKHNGDLEKEKEVCEAKGPAYIFTQGRNDNNPGCGNCYCCRQISGLMPTFSPREAPVEGSDYALSFENKASKVHLLMEKGTDVKFEGDVDNIYVEYVSSDKGNKGWQTGWCNDMSGAAQTSGVKSLWIGAFNKEECLVDCRKHADATACELHPKWGCSVHTKYVRAGNGRSPYQCFVF